MSAYSDLVSTDAPIAWWRLGESSGDAIDTQVGHDGTVTGTTRDVAGGIYGDANTAYTFDGVDDQILIADHAEFDLSSFSLEAWVKSSSFGTGRRRIISQQATHYWILALSANVAEMGFQQDTVLTTRGGALNDNKWHHLVYTRTNNDANGHKLYIDGAQAGAAVASGDFTTASAVDVYIGRYSGGSEFFTGTMDEVAVYNVALSAAQVLSHWDAGRTPPELRFDYSRFPKPQLQRVA